MPAPTGNMLSEAAATTVVDQSENEFRNIKLKLKGPNRHSELQAVKALMAMSAQQNLVRCSVAGPPQQPPELLAHKSRSNSVNSSSGSSSSTTSICNDPHAHQIYNATDGLNVVRGNIDHTQVTKKCHRSIKAAATAASLTSRDKPIDLSRSESPEPIYGLSISMTEEEFKELAEREGIEDVIGEPICKLCGGLFSGPLGIALHMCPAMKRQTFRCEICGEDKWKTKANLHSHIKWCKKRFSMKTEQHESKQIY